MVPNRGPAEPGQPVGSGRIESRGRKA